jgi:hypothetical protein
MLLTLGPELLSQVRFWHFSEVRLAVRGDRFWIQSGSLGIAGGG